MKTHAQKYILLGLAGLLTHCGPPTAPTTIAPTVGSPSNTTGLPGASGTGPVASGTSASSVVGGTGSPTPVGSGSTSSGTLSELVTTVGSTGLGTGTMQGSVGGFSMTPQTVFFDAVGSGTSTIYAGVFFSNDSSACNSLVNDSNFQANSIYALLLLSAVDNNGNNLGLTETNYQAIDPNVSNVAAGTYSTFMFEPVDGACGPELAGTNQAAEAGQFTLTSLAVGSNAVPNSLIGNFTLNIGTSASTLTGTVNAVPCPGMLALLLNSNSKLGCE